MFVFEPTVTRQNLGKAKDEVRKDIAVSVPGECKPLGN